MTDKQEITTKLTCSLIGTEWFSQKLKDSSDASFKVSGLWADVYDSLKEVIGIRED